MNAVTKLHLPQIVLTTDDAERKIISSVKIIVEGASSSSNEEDDADCNENEPETRLRRTHLNSLRFDA